MSASSSNEIGRRIAAARTARRMTQPALAAAAHVSLSTLRKAEQGSRPVSERLLYALADALDVDPDRLTGKRAHTDSRVHATIPAVRTAVDTYDLPDDGPVRSLPHLHTAVATATRQRLSSQYTRISETAPELLAELTRAVHSSTGAEQEDAAALLAAAYRAADAVAYKYGYYDLSARLVELMRWAAALSGDPVLTATAAYVRTEIFFASRNLAPGLRALEAATSAMPPPVTVPARAALGALHMRAAVVAARLLEDRGTVDDHLRNARRLADQVSEGIYNGTAFGPASMRIHEVSVAVELGDGSRAVEVAGSWAPPRELPAERRSHYYIDLSRAQLWVGLRDEAFQSLHTARQIAPQHVREHPYVRDTLATLLRLHLAPAQALVSYAEWARAI
ncbi:MAG: helix-turn-helix domain protein [Actinomycetia bacterium]|nr:helix-turn-helix domain protein [Actinomycetes bacterium]